MLCATPSYALALAEVADQMVYNAVREGSAPWQGTAALGVTARRGDWRLRSGITASDRNGWRIDGANLSAARKFGAGNLALDLDWQRLFQKSRPTDRSDAARTADFVTCLVQG